MERAVDDRKGVRASPTTGLSLGSGLLRSAALSYFSSHNFSKIYRRRCDMKGGFGHCYTHLSGYQPGEFFIVVPLSPLY